MERYVNNNFRVEERPSERGNVGFQDTTAYQPWEPSSTEVKRTLRLVPDWGSFPTESSQARRCTEGRVAFRGEAALKLEQRLRKPSRRSRHDTHPCSSDTDEQLTLVFLFCTLNLDAPDTRA
jgi:hypothetical protein